MYAKKSGFILIAYIIIYCFACNSSEKTTNETNYQNEHALSSKRALIPDRNNPINDTIERISINLFAYSSDATTTFYVENTLKEDIILLNNLCRNLELNYYFSWDGNIEYHPNGDEFYEDWLNSFSPPRASSLNLFLDREFRGNPNYDFVRKFIYIPKSKQGLVTILLHEFVHAILDYEEEDNHVNVDFLKRYECENDSIYCSNLMSEAYSIPFNIMLTENQYSWIQTKVYPEKDNCINKYPKDIVDSLSASIIECCEIPEFNKEDIDMILNDITNLELDLITSICRRIVDLIKCSAIDVEIDSLTQLEESYVEQQSRINVSFNAEKNLDLNTSKSNADSLRKRELLLLSQKFLKVWIYSSEFYEKRLKLEADYLCKGTKVNPKKYYNRRLNDLKKTVKLIMNDSRDLKNELTLVKLPDFMPPSELYGWTFVKTDSISNDTIKLYGRKDIKKKIDSFGEGQVFVTYSGTEKEKYINTIDTCWTIGSLIFGCRSQYKKYKE